MSSRCNDSGFYAVVVFRNWGHLETFGLQTLFTILRSRGTLNPRTPLERTINWMDKGRRKRNKKPRNQIKFVMKLENKSRLIWTVRAAVHLRVARWVRIHFKYQCVIFMLLHQNNISSFRYKVTQLLKKRLPEQLFEFDIEQLYW